VGTGTDELGECDVAELLGAFEVELEVECACTSIGVRVSVSETEVWTAVTINMPEDEFANAIVARVCGWAYVLDIWVPHPAHAQ